MLAISKTSKRVLSASVLFLSTFTIIFLTESLVKAADLGAVDLNGFCRYRYMNSIAIATRPDPNNQGATGWKCKVPNNIGGVDFKDFSDANFSSIVEVCNWQYNRANATAQALNFGDPYSWRCYADVIPTNQLIRATNINKNYYPGRKWITYTGYKLEFQTDRNLVLYNPSGKAIWATGTNGAADMLSVQTDGNVVLYGGSKALWATNTSGNNGAYFAIQSDGNLVVYNTNNRPIFSTATAGGSIGTFSAAADWSRPKYLEHLASWTDFQWEDAINSAADINAINKDNFNLGSSGNITSFRTPVTDMGIIYRDLSTALFGNEKRFKFTGAYISDDYYKATGGAYGYHGGIDIWAPIGTEVNTLVSGKVVLVDMRWGLLTIQDANGINYIYKHLSQVLVSQGSSVTAGQKVAKTGITAADAAHLHYEITRKDYIYGALQTPTKKTKEEARQRTYNPFKNYWAMRRI